VKKIFSLILLSLGFTIAIAQTETKSTDEKKLSALKAKAIDVNNIAQTDFLKKNEKGFTDVIINPATIVKNQQSTGTCWSFSGTSLLESQSLKNKTGNLDLSEMYFVRGIYIDKAKNYFLRQGNARFSEGALGHDVIQSISKYGVLPQSSYSGLTDNATSYDHGKLIVILKKYLDSAINATSKSIPAKGKEVNADWERGYYKILDKYLGVAPQEFTYNKKTYSPISFAKEVLKFNAEDYINLTSFTHHPFYSPFILEVPDNFSNGAYFNIPLNELTEVVINAIKSGYTVVWDADVSNNGFNAKMGFALHVSQETGKRLAESTEDIIEEDFDAAKRQRLFENLTTQDDHLMHIIGIEKSKEGKTFFIVKNSWGDATGPFNGFMHVSEAYFAINTISIVLPKAALDKTMLEKLKIKQ
jgi:bleomycin hydrolase